MGGPFHDQRRPVSRVPVIAARPGGPGLHDWTWRWLDQVGHDDKGGWTSTLNGEPGKSTRRGGKRSSWTCEESTVSRRPLSQPARFSRGCNGPKGTFADPYRWVPHCVFGIFPHINWELRDLAGTSHAVATGRVTSRGLRVGTPGPWAGRAKGRCPGACPSGFLGGPVPCCRRRHPVVRRTRQRCRAAKAAQGGPFSQHTLGPYRMVPAKIWNRGGLTRWGFVRCPWCLSFTAALWQPQGWGT